MKNRFWKKAVLVSVLTMTFVFHAAAEETTEENESFGNEIFSVSVSPEVASACDIETEDNGIFFYQTVSRENFGGFVGSIQLYENLKDYNMIPAFERGGEIDFPDGRKYDVVLVYPSDVQVDPRIEENAEEYRMLHEAIPSIAATITPEGDGVYIPQEDVDNTGIYEEVLVHLAECLKEQKDRDALIEEGFSDLYAYTYALQEEPLDLIGYAYVDVNHDGYQELVLGSVGDPTVYDLYANVGGEPVHILSGGERNAYSLSDNGGIDLFIRNDASGSAFCTETKFYYLQSDWEELVLQTGFLYDEEKDKENPWFFTYGSGEPEPAAEEEWLERMERFGEKTDPGYTALSALQ